MNNSLFQDKKGLSEIISYVLLVVIAVGLSVLVFGFLTLYTPKDNLSCPEDIRIVVDKLNCASPLSANDNATLNIEITNRGLFKLDAAYVRFSKEGRKVRQLINDPNEVGLHHFYLSPGKDLPGENIPPAGLNPGESSIRNYSLSSSVVPSAPSSYTVEVQPAVLLDSQLVICESAVITQSIKCE